MIQTLKGYRGRHQFDSDYSFSGKIAITGKHFQNAHIYLLIGSGGSRWVTMRGSSPPAGLFIL